jgi:putative ABC transport system permease protein
VAIPLVYNIRSVRRRWASSLVAVLGIAGTVAVFVAMLALARGFKATIVASGLPQNAIVQQSGADSEMTSAVTIEALRVVEDMPQVERRGRRDRGAADARHRQRRQRADARRLAARALGA